MRSIINRFKEFRRPRKPRKVKVCGPPTNQVTKPKSPGMTYSVTKPTIPPGEDAVSYERHIKALQMEFKKSHRNNRLIGEKNHLTVSAYLLQHHVLIADDLMDRSFAMRREEIEAKQYGIEVLISRFPFIQELDYVSNSSCTKPVKQGNNADVTVKPRLKIVTRVTGWCLTQCIIHARVLVPDIVFYIADALSML